MSSGFEPIDNYEVASFIAGGGTSQVLEVIEPGTSRRLAMKLISNNHPDAKLHKASLKAEAAICKQLDHPNVIHYEGFTNGREHTYMLMEYFRAPTLKVQLKMDVVGVHLRMKKLIEGLSAAMQHVHDRGFIHRDIKPENVLMNKVGEIRLIDFSLTVKQKSGLSAMFAGKQSVIQGTRTYIAPETIRKRPPVLQTDFYSLGILLFEVLTGKTPFQAPTPNELLQKHLSATPPNASEFNKNVTPEMDRLILKLLSKKPEQRGKDMAEVAAELRRVRVFKEDIAEPTTVKQEESPANLLDQLADGKLDSRLDAQRSEIVRNNPELASELARQQKVRQDVAKAKKAKLAEQIKQSNKPKSPKVSEPAPPAPPPPQAYPYPSQPGYAYPMMQPGAQFPPGYPQAMGYPQGAQAYGAPMSYPGMPPTGYPGYPQGTPNQPQPPSGPAASGGGANAGAPVYPAPEQGRQASASPQVPGAAPVVPLDQSAELASLIKSAESNNPPKGNRSSSPRTPPSPPQPPPQASDEDLDYMTELPDIL